MKEIIDADLSTVFKAAMEIVSLSMNGEWIVSIPKTTNSV